MLFVITKQFECETIKTSISACITIIIVQLHPRLKPLLSTFRRPKEPINCNYFPTFPVTTTCTCDSDRHRYRN